MVRIRFPLCSSVSIHALIFFFSSSLKNVHFSTIISGEPLAINVCIPSLCTSVIHCLFCGVKGDSFTNVCCAICVLCCSVTFFCIAKSKPFVILSLLAVCV